MRLLLVKTSSMGDVIHALPAVSDAVQAVADLQVDWVVEENFQQIPGWHGAVREVIPVAIRRWRKSWFSRSTREECRAFRRKIRAKNYDLVIDAQGLLKSALLIACNAGGIRHGMDWRSVREPVASLFYQQHHQVARQQHAVERCRELLAKSLGYSKPQQRGDYAIAGRFLPCGESVRYAVFLHATSREEKLWPEAQWRELISWVAQHTDWQIKLPWGSAAERQRARRLAAGFAHVEVLPQLSLEQIAALLANAIQVVSVDTGLSHLAAALDRANITLYGPTDPGLIGGYGQQQQAIRSPTLRMEDIPCARVTEILQHAV